MYRGTTPTIKIELDIDTTLLESGYVTFKQENEVVLEKEICNCELEGNLISFKLTQEETLSLKVGSVVAQLRVKQKDGTTIAYDPFQVYVKDVFKEGVI